MEFSEKEMRMVRWLRGQHAYWHSTRMIIVVFSLLMIGVAILEWNRGDRMHTAILFGLALGGLSYTLGSWSGRPEISLLLKLVEEHLPDKPAGK